MNTIVVNELSLNIEMDSKALAEIVGGGDYILSTLWKYLSTTCTFKKWVKKQGQWYKRTPNRFQTS